MKTVAKAIEPAERQARFDHIQPHYLEALTLIERLSPEQRQVLTLKFVFRFSNGEAAAILGKTEGAVKSLQHRALASLQKHVTR